ncbi:hypothetical protein [Dysgonomonas sp. Marseille-P4677]|uniref:hypothetical protein n=1 Tax=Dysgonomonas sp. Marseille-P4677 TaxID=2364790 RepID=UPI0019136685|nr:hypothetical protein [Dysgonomonas sp. Marseille-P4677]
MPAQETRALSQIHINDIIIKDVWLYSGQSNMELPIRRTVDFKTEISIPQKLKDKLKKITNPFEMDALDKNIKLVEIK